MFDITWKEAITKAVALKALGNTNIYLSGPDDEKPWHLAQSCRPGGSHRIDMETSVWFKGGHDGLTFEWSFDIEEPSASGQPGYRIDIKRVAAVMAKLQPAVSEQFRTYLTTSAKKVRASAEEFLRYASKQYTDAHMLDHIAQIEVSQTAQEA